MLASPATILVIEKHPLMRAAIVNAIADEPDLTIGAVASDGRDTLQIVESLHPEIILFALGNPGDDDLSAMRELHERSPNIALLALTASEAPGQGQAAMKCGASAAIVKTSSRAELLQTLRMIKASVKHSKEDAFDKQRSK